MHAVYAALAVVVLLPSLVWAQWSRVNLSHPMAQGLIQWHLVTPLLSGGPDWYNLIGPRHGTLVNMGSNEGWQSLTYHAQWWGEMRFDGGDDGIFLPVDPAFNFNNQSFTVGMRFRSANTGSGYLISRHDAVDISGGWFIRINSGPVLARLYGSSFETVAAQTATTVNDNVWRSAVVVFTTSTTVPANNTVVIYLNGISDSTITESPITTGYDSCSTCALTFGRLLDGTGPLLGALDDVRIWNRALSATEAMAYHTSKPPGFDGLLLTDTDRVLALPTTPTVKRRVTIQ